MSDLPIDADLRAWSARGLTRWDRAVPLVVTLPIPILVIVGEVWEFLHFGEYDGIGLGVILAPIAALNLYVGLHSSFVDRAPGAIRLTANETSLELHFADGRVDVYTWSNPHMRLRLITLRAPTEGGRPSLIVLKSFLRPPSQIPDDVVSRLSALIERLGLPVTVSRKQLRHYGNTTVREIHGSRIATGEPG